MTKELQLEESNLEKKMWTAGYKDSWRKMEAAAQYRVEDGEERSAAYVPLVFLKLNNEPMVNINGRFSHKREQKPVMSKPRRISRIHVLD